jgi:hypothetical protein
MLTQPKSPGVEEGIDQELNDIDAESDLRDAKLQALLDREVARLRTLGLVDDRGQRVRKELPASMQESSGCDLG